MKGLPAVKRIVSLLASAALLLPLLSACSISCPESTPDAAPDLEWTVSDLAGLAFEGSGRGGQDGLEAVNAEMDREWLAAYIENAYELQLPWEDAAVIRATGASAFEIAVLRMADEDAAARAASCLTDYMFGRQGDFTGYAPAEADMAANGSVMQKGPFAALFICPDPDGARRMVQSALNGEYDPSRPAPSREAIDDVKGLRDFLVSGQGMDEATLEKLDDGDPDALNAYMEDAYGLALGQGEECAIARGTGDSAFEVAVVRVLGDWDRISAVERGFNGYLDAREAQFDSSAEQARLLHQAITIEAGEYVVLLACPDAEQAADAFSEASGTMGYGWSPRYRYRDTDPDYPDRCAFNPPNDDDMSLYDTSAIRSAWEKGDPSGLSQYDRNIYDQAERVLKKVLKDGMSGYEKETAIYGWIVQNVDYDWTHQDAMKETPRESFTPYGGLVNRTAVCLGYAATFQLLCDLAGVECITVVGAAFESLEDHGWNMVRLSGEWYCVDATWDANAREYGGSGRMEDWSYFNVTSDYMADTDHQWDYANTPEATAEDYGRG